MSFLPPVVGCLLKTWLTKGGSRAPRTLPGYASVKGGLYLPFIHVGLLHVRVFFLLQSSIRNTYQPCVFSFFRTPAGYCFVDFGDYAGSQKVMAKLNGLPIPGSNPVSI